MTTIARPRMGAGADAVDKPGLLARAIRGPLEDSAWVRPALIGVAVLTAFIYLWDLTISGYANTYYARPRRLLRRAGAPGSSARSMPATSSLSTSRRSPRWSSAYQCASSA